MSNSIKCVTKVFIFIIYFFIILFILYHHYVEAGECAVRVYYYPLGIRDFILIPFVGIVMLSVSLYIFPVSKKLQLIEVFIYACIIITTLLCGKNILASRTINWPDSYKVSQICEPSRELTALRDTVTNVYTWNLISIDNKRKPIISYERLYTFNNETIYHVKEDFLTTSINVDSLNTIIDLEFSRLFYLEDTRQNHVRGYYYSSIVFIENNLMTQHISSYCKEYCQADSPHGDSEDYYITTSLSDDSFTIEEIFIDGTEKKLKKLVADAIIEYRKNNWWRDRADTDIEDWRKEFMNWDVTVSDKAALVDKGVVFSFSYGTPNMDICYAENYIHAFVPYYKLDGLLKP